MRQDLICPACGSVNDFAGSFLGHLGLVEHHRCRWCSAHWFVDEIEPDFLRDCEVALEFAKLLPEPEDMPRDN